MRPTSSSLRRLLPRPPARQAPATAPAPARLERFRITHSDGARTTLHVATYERRAYAARIALLPEPLPLARWCAEEGISHAIVGGFFVRPQFLALGQVQIAGGAQPHVPFDHPWGVLRACLQVDGDQLRIARRDALDPEPRGDLLQAGPLLVSAGEPAVRDGLDTEGFSAGARQFDSDITVGRYPRAALGVDEDRVLAVACDGRTRRDAGMTLGELTKAMQALGALDALNLDGGGSASLVHHGRLRNRPREQHGVDVLGGRAIVTAITFELRW
jgi:hypothetical protein